MKNDNIVRIQRCPFCGKTYRGVPATSRTDGKTQICPDCGTREALESIGVSADEQEEILGSIHKYKGRNPS